MVGNVIHREIFKILKFVKWYMYKQESVHEN